MSRLSPLAAIETGKLILGIRDTIDRCQSNLESNYHLLADVRDEIDKRLASSPNEYILPAWRIMRIGIAVLASHGKCLEIAHGGSGDLPTEQARLKVLLGELQAQLRATIGRIPAIDELAERLVVSADCDNVLVTQFLLMLPLTPIYWDSEEDTSAKTLSVDPTKESPPPLVRLIAQLDNAPLATPQLINPNRLYSLKFEIRGIGWTDEAESLHLSLATTLPHDGYSISPFELPRPKLDEVGEYVGELAGQIKFNAAQSTLFDDIIFRLRGAFKLRNGEYEDVPIIGYHELKVRVVDHAQHPWMGPDHRLDQHVEKLLIKLSHDCPTAAAEIAQLHPLLQALNFLIVTYAQEAIFKGISTIPEAEFHKTVLRDLRLRLGPEVQDHPHQAGGIVDLRYRGLIVELKVEKDTSDRKKIAQKYAAQATQYQGVEARQVSVVLVLDLTPKHSPPGDLRNDIFIVDVPTHGGNDDAKPFPSKSVVVVINGNVRSPSDYSA